MKTAKEKMVVFRCKGCIEDLKEYNPYINKNGEQIALENIICIEVPQERCENTDFELTPILLDRQRYYDIPFEEQALLISRAITNAMEMGCKALVKMWWGDNERKNGLPMTYFMQPVSQMGDFLHELDWHYGEGGCIEIVIEDDANEYAIYHTDATEKYLLDDLFEFMEKR